MRPICVKTEVRIFLREGLDRLQAMPARSRGVLAHQAYSMAGRLGLMTNRAVTLTAVRRAMLRKPAQ